MSLQPREVANIHFSIKKLESGRSKAGRQMYHCGLRAEMEDGTILEVTLPAPQMESVGVAAHSMPELDRCLRAIGTAFYEEVSDEEEDEAEES